MAVVVFTEFVVLSVVVVGSDILGVTVVDLMLRSGSKMTSTITVPADVRPFVHVGNVISIIKYRRSVLLIFST